MIKTFTEALSNHQKPRNNPPVSTFSLNPNHKCPDIIGPSQSIGHQQSFSYSLIENEGKSYTPNSYRDDQSLKSEKGQEPIIFGLCLQIT
ncbi:hypothetical protein Peur_017216 [Populus x canadensis]